MASVNKDVTPTDRVDLDFCAFFAPFMLLFCLMSWVGLARPRLLGFSF
jgi:hypothetical protein